MIDEVQTRRGLRYEFRRVYLTRTQVAQRLHKSRTAIIALEGTALYPERGPGEVRLFEIEDVELLAGKPLGDEAHSRWFKRHRQESQPRRAANRRTDMVDTEVTARIEELQRENTLLHAMLTEQIEAWEQVQFSFAQRRIERKVRRMLEQQLEALHVGAE